MSPVLNYIFGMQRVIGIFVLLGLALLLLAAAPVRPRLQATTPLPATTTPPLGIAILSPLPGQPLQGTVAIVINTNIPDFASAELSFAYAKHPLDTWFLLYESNQPVADAAVMQWDTNAISDGDYRLRLTVELTDGSQRTVEVTNLRVRNYSPIETNTPTPATPTATPPPQDTLAPTLTPTASWTPRPPTPTPLPRNPLALHPSQVALSAAQGGMAAAVVFALLGLYTFLRRLGKKR